MGYHLVLGVHEILIFSFIIFRDFQTFTTNIYNFKLYKSHPLQILFYFIFLKKGKWKVVKCPALNWGSLSKASRYLPRQSEVSNWKESWGSSSSPAWHPRPPWQCDPPLCYPFALTYPAPEMASSHNHHQIELIFHAPTLILLALWRYFKAHFPQLGWTFVSLLWPLVALYSELFYNSHHLPCPGVLCTQVWLSQMG